MVGIGGGGAGGGSVIVVGDKAGETLSGPYAGEWLNILGNLPADGIKRVSSNSNNASKLYYNYQQIGGTSTFETPNNDGQKYTDPDLVGYYQFIGFSQHISLEETEGWNFTSIWNSDVARSIIPDMMGINLNVNVTIGLGLSFTFQASLLTRGTDAGFHFSKSLYVTAGEQMGISVNEVNGNFMGNADKINFNSLLGTGISAEGSLGDFGIGAWESLNSNGNATWFGNSIGIGPGFGASVGTGTSW